jgi:3',5'-cyclic AMP phosphodiesterase CpdA
MEFLLHTGDMVGRDTPKEWEAYREATATFRKPLRVVIGNHELHGGGKRERFSGRFGLPGTSYSFNHKDAHFAIVDNAGGSLPETTLAWLDRDLSDHPKGKDGISVIVVAMHIPPRTDGIAPHGTANGYEAQSGKLLGILKRHRADLVLCGHEHMQAAEDWDGIRVVVSGGAGAPLMPFQQYGYYRIDVENGTVREMFQPVKPPKP